MSRLQGSRAKSAPKYRLHKPSQNAVVTINGKNHYLGKYGTDESHELYRRKITESWGQSVTTIATAETVTVKTSLGITISEIAVLYAKHCKAYYRKNGEPTSEWTVCKLVLKRLRSIYGSLVAKEFGPLKYQAFRQSYIDDGLARTTINKYCWHVQKMFQHAGRNELVPMSFYRDLEGVGNLLDGRSAARETDDVMPVDPEILDATIAELHPVTADMVRLQLLAGMRPGETRNLRPCDIDRLGDVWKYTPPSHKNEHKSNRKSKIRVICFGPLSQELLSPYLLRDHRSFCFCPCEVDVRGRGAQYTKDSFNRAITRAALRANPYPEKIVGNAVAMKEWRKQYCWSPNQLRHNALTLARKLGGLETAQQIAGHAQSKTTEASYAEIDSDRAIEFARKFG